MKRTKSYKYRLYPNVTQKALLNKTFGCVRFYWNNLVESFNSFDKEFNPNPKYCTQKELKGDFDWLSEVSAAALQQKKRDFDEAKRQYFNKNKKTIIGRMTFKARRSKQSYRLPNPKFKVLERHIRLEKIGRIRAAVDRPIPECAKLLSVTVSKNSGGQYFASVLVEQEIQVKTKTNRTVGIDVGLKEFATLSDGGRIHNPKYFVESQGKLRAAQQHLSRKVRGSGRCEKQRIKVAKIHQKAANQRSWFLHNLSYKLVSGYDIISVEDLNIKGMMRNKRLAKSIGDVGWGELFRMLNYKCEWYGKTLVKIGRFEPSSKTCSCCGHKKDDLALNDRVFACPVCGLEIDRDLNAAINIKRVGVDALKQSWSERKTFSEAVCDETMSGSGNHTTIY